MFENAEILFASCNINCIISNTRFLGEKKKEVAWEFWLLFGCAFVSKFLKLKNMERKSANKINVFLKKKKVA